VDQKAAKLGDSREDNAIIEDVNASSRQGLDEIYTTREVSEVGFKRLALKWDCVYSRC
jgi:hypothetical protein